MRPTAPFKAFSAAVAALAVSALAQLSVTAGVAQDPPRVRASLPDAPQVLQTAAAKIRVVPITGFSYPWALAFLPDGRLLVSEKGKTTLRIIRDGVLDPRPITGLPQGVNFLTPPLARWAGHSAGVDIAPHPKFAENNLIYFSYWKPKPDNQNARTAVLIRARLDGYELKDVKELFEANSWLDGPSAARIVFGRDGKIYMVTGATGYFEKFGDMRWAQDPGQHAGKILRLNEDGSVPSDNPFVGRVGYKPEIFALGIRNAIGLTVHPHTGEIWESEHGPQGGDEINIVKRGANYGWPLVTYGRAYNYDRDWRDSQLVPPNQQPPSQAPGMEEPFTFYKPSIAVSGITFYTGDRFPLWRGNLLVAGLAGTQISRITFNPEGVENRREAMLLELRQRIRDVKQGPDGLVYATTDMPTGAVLKIEPVIDEESRELAATVDPGLAPAQGKTVWDGVYTEAQAERGEQLFAQQCAQCHSPDLRGSDLAPALVGDVFAAKWNDLALDQLFEIMRLTMPQDQPGSLTRDQMAEVLAFVLQQGGVPAGAAELLGQRDPLSRITYVSREP